MRKAVILGSLVVMLALLLAGAPAVQAEEGLVGHWQGTWKCQRGPNMTSCQQWTHGPMFMDLSKSNGKVSGNLALMNYANNDWVAAVESASLEGGSFKAKVNFGCNGETTELTGTVSGYTLNGRSPASGRPCIGVFTFELKNPPMP